MTESNRFDLEAASWDQQDRRLVLAKAVVASIASRVPLSKTDSLLDFGCGTGLVLLELASRVGSLTGADTSKGMLETLAAKAQDAGCDVRLISPDEGLGGPYDVIVSSMTLHHVESVPPLLNRLAGVLRTGGHIALADLDEEDGSFHGESPDVFHKGFSRSDLRAWLQAAGFCDIVIETAHVVDKGGRDYPVFLATARKS